MITNLKIKNFKCFREEKFSFKNITVLAGTNGSGKSSVIQSILLYRRALEVMSLNKDEVEVNGFYLLNLGEADKVINKNSIVDDESGKRYIEFNLKFIEGLQDNLILTSREQSPLSLEIESGHGAIIQSKFLEDYYFSYLNAERIGPRKKTSMRDTRLLDTGFQGEYTTYVIEQCDNRKIKIHEQMILQESNSEKFSHQVEGWLRRIISDVSFKITSMLNTGEVMISYDDDILPPSTGFGISYTLPIIVNGLLASSEPKSIMLVENPEAHLHPKGQSRIGRFLALLAISGVQVILETHSEHVLNGIRLELAANNSTDKGIVYFISREQSENKLDKQTKVEQIIIKPNGELNTWPKDFFDQDKNDLRELLRLKMEKK